MGPSRDGEIGRRGGLKNLWEQSLAGSSPRSRHQAKTRVMWEAVAPPGGRFCGTVCQYLTHEQVSTSPYLATI